MSESLIVHICKGPATIKHKPSIAKAKKHVAEVIKAARFAKKCLDEDKEAVLDKMRDEKHPLLQLLEPMMKNDQFSSYKEADFIIEGMVLTKPNRVVNEFIEWWNRGDANDTAWRMDPDNRRLKIVVCGAGTWGDSPDGQGFNLMQEVWRFDLPHRFGIR
jgi:hypothetical protein